MGSNWSKLKKYVEKGDEQKVLEIYNKSSDIRKKLNANSIVNDLTLDTYMHLSAIHGMVEFLKLLLYENNGNPNKLNRNNQTVLHKCCQGSKDNVQYECLKLLLQWREISSVSNNVINYSSSANMIKQNQNFSTEINVNAKDKFESTPLHYAAMRNLPTCVQTLFTYGAFLFIENAEHSTPCDLAERYGQKDIALFLESKMIFSKEVDEIENENDEEQQVIVVEEKPNFGLRIKDLQEEKDKLLIETADILRCSIFTAEIMLKKHAWSKEKLLNSWIEDPIKCCEKCGISSAAIDQFNSQNDSKNISKTDNHLLKTKIFQFHSEKIIARKMSGRYIVKKKDSSTSLKTNSAKLDDKNSTSVGRIIENDAIESNEISTNSLSLTNDKSETDILNCEICFCSFDVSNEQLNNNCSFVEIICGHKFCKACWEQYLTIKIEEGNVSDIVCPQVDCFAIIPHSTIESLVSKEIAEKYSHFDIKAFVDSNPTIKWCPFPGCGMAVRNPNLNTNQNTETDQHGDQNCKEFSSTVDCGSGHYFCWDCLQEAHEPATCKNWKDWYQKILEIKPEELNNTAENEAFSANYLWLVTNSKKCPNANCNAPIQKNEGCNHVKCYKCKHDFCWICLESWKKHSSVTGGYFQCNRYEASTKILQKQSDTIARAEDTHLKAVELNKFIHYYTRFKNHEHSYKIEEPLLAMAKTKFEILIAQNTVANSEKLPIDLSIKPNNNGNNQDISLRPEIDDKLLDIDSIDPVIDIEKKSTKSKGSKNDSSQGSQVLNASAESHLFIEEAIKELLKARKILRCSYVYGYYLDTFGHKKFIFEFIQTEFEESTENLSQIIARPHLKTPKHKIVKLTNVLRKKRLEFLDTIIRGLNSFNDTPPALKKYSRQRWKYLLKDNIQNDDEFKNTIALSLKELNPKNPWIIDRKGRHTNLLALLNDWPELEQELDSILVPSKEKKVLCAKWDCGNVRAVNSLSGSLCNYCSIRCMRSDRNAYLEDRRILTCSNPSTSSSKSDKFQQKELINHPSSINITASTSKSINIPEAILKKANFRFNKAKSSHSSSLGSNNSINKKLLKDDLLNNSKIKSNIYNKVGYDYDHEFDIDPDTDLLNAIEVSKLQYYIDLSNKDNKLESDTQKAIELSLNRANIDDEELHNDYSNNDSATTSSSSTSKLNDSSNNDSFNINSKASPQQIHLNLENKSKNITVPFDTLFLNSSNENDISVIIKNMEKVLYEKTDHDKIDKVCNFQVKIKK